MIPVSPLLSYPLFLGSGIVAGWYGGLGKNYAYLLLPLFVIIIILLVRRRKTPLLGIVFFLTLGAFLGAREQQRRVINYEVASSYRDQEITVIGTVVSTPSPSTGWINSPCHILIGVSVFLVPVLSSVWRA
jgi:hypothetical protein